MFKYHPPIGQGGILPAGFPDKSSGRSIPFIAAGKHVLLDVAITGMHHNTAEFPGRKTASGIQPAACKHCASHAGSVGQAHKILKAFTGAKDSFSNGCCIDIILDSHRNMKFLFHNFLQHGSGVAWNIFIGINDTALDRIYLPCSADAYLLKRAGIFVA